MLSWRYAGRYSEYNLDPQDSEVLRELLRARNHYHVIVRDNEMVGFFCWGVDARVPGWKYDNKAIDVGMGLRPDLTGKGQGSIHLHAVLAQVSRANPGSLMRATIVGWNKRAIHLCERAGFRIMAKFKSHGCSKSEYVVLLREPCKP